MTFDKAEQEPWPNPKGSDHVLIISRAFHFYLESVKMLYSLVFAARRMVKGAAILTRFALEAIDPFW